MQNLDIKNGLIKEFMNKFNINDYINFKNSESQTLTYQVIYNYWDSKEFKHSRMLLYIIIHKALAEKIDKKDILKNPFTKQNNDKIIQLIDWDIYEIETICENEKAPFMITKYDLYKVINKK